MKQLSYQHNTVLNINQQSYLNQSTQNNQQTRLSLKQRRLLNNSSLFLYIIEGRSNAMPQRKCAVASCRNYVTLPERYCTEHSGYNNSQYNKHVRYNDDNKKYSTFYHSTQWRNARKAKLMEQPLCEVCLAQGKYTKADMVHHKIELRSPNGWKHRLDLNNLESICYECHNKEEHSYSWKNRGRQQR